MATDELYITNKRAKITFGIDASKFHDQWKAKRQTKVLKNKDKNHINIDQSIKTRTKTYINKLTYNT